MHRYEEIIVTCNVDIKYNRVGANSDFETNSIHFLKMKRVWIRIVFGFQKTIQIYSNSSNYSNMNTNSANSSCYLTIAGSLDQ